MSSARFFFSSEEQERIVKAIKQAEKNTSGEIRVHIDRSTKLSALDRASFIFKKLNMHETEARNGVLLYLAVDSRLFAIIGDVGVNRVVHKDFWEQQKTSVLNSFKEGAFCEPLIQSILEIGNELKKYFPYQSDDKNELPDELSF